MPVNDLPLAQLREFRSDATEPADFDDFWARALQETTSTSEGAATYCEPFRPDIYGRLAIDDVTFPGANGDPIRAWFLRPTAMEEPTPCLVSFSYYGGGRGVPVEHTAYASAGYAQFVMDCRGQGAWEGYGATGDPGGGASGPERPGMLTRGLASPESYYYRRLFCDSVRAVETAASHPQVDPERIAVAGESQGGALALAASALAPEQVKVCYADIPFLCHIERALELAGDVPYTELVDYLSTHVDEVESALATLSYFDCVFFAKRVRAHCLLSVGLMDEICPPSTVFAAYNEIRSTKELEIYRFAGHHVPPLHRERQFEHFVKTMA